MMGITSITPDRAGHLDHFLVKKYLENTGWNLYREWKESLAIYRRGDLAGKDIIVPLHPDYSDYGQKMAETVSALALIEVRMESEVFQELLLSPVDILKFRYTGAQSNMGLLPFAVGKDFFEGYQKILKQTANQIFHESTNSAWKMLEDCRIGPTEPGSYVIPVLNPISTLPLLGHDSEQINEAPQRKITFAFVSNLTKLLGEWEFRNFILSEAPLLYLNDDSLDLCDAMLSFRPPWEAGELTIDAVWSRMAAPPKTTVPVSITSAHFQKFENLVKQRNKNKKPTKGVFIGHINQLKGRENPYKLMEGEVIFSFELNGELCKARVNLKQEHHEQAIEAYRTRQYTRIEGELKKGTKIHEVLNVTKFQILSDTLTF